MDIKLLPENFFLTELLEEVSAARVAYFSVSPEFEDRLQEAVRHLILEDKIQPERKKIIEAERERIPQLDTGEAVVKFIRSGCDMVNHRQLCEKILTMQEEVMPPLLRRFRTSYQDELVETATYIIAQADPAYVRQLADMYPEIRNPYAQSMACLIFGIRQLEDTLPLLLREYQRMKKEYPGESFCQGPLLAIYILYDMA